ncbi:MAG: DNA methylase [Actinobacteria bacterium]|nr:DNA methylase [Actinomycetota bacterium]
MPLEDNFDAAFAAELALQEKQIQQSYRPVIGVHKWFARRPGTLFRNLLLSEYNGATSLSDSYYHAHQLEGVIADPFMGGGTPLIEANRLGFGVIGSDINPMAYWIVRQELSPIDDEQLAAAARDVVDDVAQKIGDLYRTRCGECGAEARVKYYLWVKLAQCPECGEKVPLFPGYLLAEKVRHPKWVFACSECHQLVELDERPPKGASVPCAHCGGAVGGAGPARRGHVPCSGCGHDIAYPEACASPPEHQMWALEYHCEHCKPSHKGRFFKAPSPADLELYESARGRLDDGPALAIPEQAIPAGDETTRLLRWGYRRYRDMFNERQLLGLATLLERIRVVPHDDAREALLTVFSDALRYQNMLCRYDTYALKGQDIFSVHGFPVGLVQCEANLLGIPRVGSGGFAHFVEKYQRAKAFCREPFESRRQGSKKQRVRIAGEQIAANLVDHFPDGPQREAWLSAAPAIDVELRPDSLDGVFTDPPYFANVQYAELMDFCYVWLRLGLKDRHVQFRGETTRSASELTGNITMGRDLAHFAAGLSAIYAHFAAALKTGAPFVFTYHHNELVAYAPLVVAVLDAGMACTAVLPAPAEMGASLHINGTGSSVLDSVFVCRRGSDASKEVFAAEGIGAALLNDCAEMQAGGVRVSLGDVRCLANGRLTQLAIGMLREHWDADHEIGERLAQAKEMLESLNAGQQEQLHPEAVLAQIPAAPPQQALALF